jgi:hypothetical protein
VEKEGIWNLNLWILRRHMVELRSFRLRVCNERRTGSFCNAILVDYRNPNDSTKMIARILAVFALLASSASAFAPVAQTGRLFTVLE